MNCMIRLRLCCRNMAVQSVFEISGSGKFKDRGKLLKSTSKIMLTRRELLTHTATLAALAPLSSFHEIFAAGNKRNFHFGACDWSLGKSGDTGAFAVAKKIGLDGIMVNMGSEKNNLHLRDKNV